MAIKTIEEQFKKLDQREHVLIRPDTYVGATTAQDIETWVYDDKTNKIIKKQISYIPAFLKIFDEAITNASDHAHRKGSKVKNIRINVSDTLDKIKVWNDGTSIPVVIHKEHKVYVPELIFGHLLSGSNYDDTEERTGAGRNGLGVKLTSIFSTKSIIDLCDGKKKYIQIFENNLEKINKPKITDSKTSYTSIEYHPDFNHFDMNLSMLNDTLSLFKKRVYDLAVYNPNLNVYFNDEPVKIKSVEDWVKLHINDDAEYFVDNINKDWTVVLAESITDKFEDCSVVNGNTTWLGGTHVNNISNQLVKGISDMLTKGKKNIKISPSDIKNKFHMFIVCTIPNPVFTSQTKETLSMRLPHTPELSSKLFKDINNSDIMDKIKSWIEMKEQAQLKKLNNKAAGKNIKINKLIDAHKAGTIESKRCGIFIAEGDSALSGVVSGMSELDRNYWGAFPIRGRFLNIREMSVSKMLQNEEVADILKILGLVPGTKYKSLDELRYGKLIFFTDADDYGISIKGLLINFIHFMFPELLELGFCYEFITPVVKATKGKTVKEYYDLNKFHKDENDGKLGGYKIKYYKGLGTNTPTEMKEMFKNIDKHLIQFNYVPERDSDKIDMLFNKKKAEDRKEWMLNNLDYDVPVKFGKKNEIDSFIDNEFIQFSNYDNIISIPAFEDGFKPSQRKIFYGAIKKNIKDEIKVAQLGGYVAEHTAYAHGEANMYGTIVGMAQDFVDTNNINYLDPIGAFGNRRDPNSAASARYIFTKLNPLIRYVFREEDDIILEYKTEEGQRIEPEYYYPIIPMQLVNGAKGIGTGWSTDIPKYDPNDIINKIKHVLRNPDGNFVINPSYKGWTGTIEKKDEDTYISTGVYVVKTNKVKITELPIGTTTDKYIEFLNKLYDNKEIRNYIDNSTDVKINIEVVFFKMPKDINKALKLSSNIKLSNMNTFVGDDIIKWEHAEDMLKEWIKWRLPFYEKRKKAYIGVLTDKFLYYLNCLNFVGSIIVGDLVVNNRSKKDIEDDLIKMNFDKRDGSFNYLLTIPIYNLSKEKFKEYKLLAKQYQTLTKEYKKKTIEELWIADLDELKNRL